MPNLKSYSQPPAPDLPAIIAMLNDAMQALHNVSCPSEAKELPDKEIVPADEIRCYRFSPLALRCEQELFAEQQAKNLHELFFKASSSVTAFASLLEHIDAEAEVEGVVIHILARELRRVEDLLFKIQDTYSTVEPVEA